MLHALLHGKLNPQTSAPQWREDVLTATVFGTLLWVEQWDLLARWLLGTTPDPRQGSARHAANDIWFWPIMTEAVPDVVVRLADVLIVVEAKYRAGRHDQDVPDDDTGSIGDQLCRQYRSIREHAGSGRRYPEAVEAAIRECRPVQAFVVDGRRGRQRTRREFEESKRRLAHDYKDAVLRFVTWQDLYRLLGEPQMQQARWRNDLRAYLEEVELDSFEGIRHRLLDPGGGRILEWRLPVSRLGFRDAASAALRSPSLERLWRRDPPNNHSSKRKGR